MCSLLCFKAVTFSIWALYGFPAKSFPVIEIDTVPEVIEAGGRIYMAKDSYGIRPQLYDFSKNELVNDFLYEVQDNIVHIINSVSPAFTSCLALSEKMISLIVQD